MPQFENDMIIRCVPSTIHQLVEMNKTQLNLLMVTARVKEYSLVAAQSIVSSEFECEKGGADKSMAKALIESLDLLLWHTSVIPAPWQTEAGAQRPAWTT